MKFIAPLIAACSLLTACVTATPYQEATKNGDGYENQQIESNRWAISFSGNSLTDRQTVETYLLYRAAELTKTSGYDHFQIVTRETDAETSFTSTGFSSPFYYNFYGFGAHSGFGRSRFRRSGFSSFGRRGFGGGFGRSGFGGGFGGGIDTIRERVTYEATAEIVMRKGVKPDNAEYFDAEDVLVNLSGRIVLPEA